MTDDSFDTVPIGGGSGGLSFKRAGDGQHITLDDGLEMTVDKVLPARGREPKIDVPGALDGKVDMTGSGHIDADGVLATPHGNRRRQWI